MTSRSRRRSAAIPGDAVPESARQYVCGLAPAGRKVPQADHPDDAAAAEALRAGLRARNET